MEAIDSIAPAAPKRWPVIDFVEFMLMFLACLPKT